jgi:hypothetical protein
MDVVGDWLRSMLLLIVFRVKVYNARLALILFYNARPVLNARNYSTKRPLFLSAVVTPYLNNAVHTPHVLYSRCHKSIVFP